MRIAVAGGTGTVGRYVVQAGERAGHEVVVLSRSAGVDVHSGEGLDGALDGVQALVDATNAATTNRAKATEFFVESTARLQSVGAAHGVTHLVTLSIVGLEGAASYGYYAAKLAHEAAARRGPVPVTVVRSTQFHEFPVQVLERTRRGPVAVVPRMRVQPVAARTVGETLLRVATGPVAPAVVELAGPEPADLVDLARAVLVRTGSRTRVVPVHVPGAAGEAMRTGALLPAPGVVTVGPRFVEWLASPDFDAVRAP